MTFFINICEKTILLKNYFNIDVQSIDFFNVKYLITKKSRESVLVRVLLLIFFNQGLLFLYFLLWIIFLYLRSIYTYSFFCKIIVYDLNIQKFFNFGTCLFSQIHESLIYYRHWSDILATSKWSPSLKFQYSITFSNY